MLQVANIRAHKNEVVAKLAVKNFDARDIVDALISLDEKRLQTQAEHVDTLANSNKLSTTCSFFCTLAKNACEKTVDEVDLVLMDGSLHSQFMTRQSALDAQVVRTMNKKRNGLERNE